MIFERFIIRDFGGLLFPITAVVAREMLTSSSTRARERSTLG
jgi:hypothetical protein